MFSRSNKYLESVLLLVSLRYRETNFSNDFGEFNYLFIYLFIFFRRIASLAGEVSRGESPVGGDLCLMNYPSRRGIRLNLKQVGGREGSSGKLIQTTRCPPPPPTSFSSFRPLGFLAVFSLCSPSRTTLLLLRLCLRLRSPWLSGRRDPRKRKGVRSYFAVVSRRSKCREARELISRVLLFRQTSRPDTP